MLEKTDLSRKLPKAQYKPRKDKLELRLAELQRRIRTLGVPVMVVFEGWEASGKGTLTNELILPLDPRGFRVYSSDDLTRDEALRPFLWRFWIRMPESGRIAVFDRSWYWHVLTRRAERKIRKTECARAFDDIRAFERQFADDGGVIIKFFLHISRQEQKRRFKKLLKHKATAWRISSADKKQHRHYEDYLAAAEDMLARSDSEFAPWTVVEAHDRRWATIRVLDTVVRALERRAEQAESLAGAARKTAAATTRPADPIGASVLDTMDLSAAISRKDYDDRIEDRQERIRELQHEIYRARLPVVILYEGWDAAGKGGNLKRLARNMDPRGYDVIPVSAPNDIEKAHHYLWRFWTHIPKAGHIAIFDRSWYGRVLVERVEGLCAESEWRRAYREINEMERHLTNFGTVLLKFWLHIAPEEQLRRFRERQRLPYKRWKITDEDWRNREKRPDYEAAVREMLFRTSTPSAPWIVVESNCKWFARIKVMDAVIRAIEERLE